jgi:heat shock protein HslJ
MPTSSLRAALLLLAASLAGCAPVTANSEAPSLDGTAWILSSLPGRTLVGRQPITLRFEGGRVAGSDGCNRYSGPFTTEGDTLSIKNAVASTMMACEPPELMEQAREFTAALAGSKGYRVVDGQLQLLGDGGKTLATFAAQSRALAGTSWRATGINNGRGAVASIVRGTTVTLAFDANGRASGSAGCNSFTAGYEASAPKLRFKAPAATRRMCAGEGVMEQEAAFLTALESVDTMRFEGDRLELRRADGALAVGLMREDAE